MLKMDISGATAEERKEKLRGFFDRVERENFDIASLRIGVDLDRNYNALQHLKTNGKITEDEMRLINRNYQTLKQALNQYESDKMQIVSRAKDR